MNKSLETLFDHLGCLYKFHQRPMTYLYNTLHYYEDRLRDRAALRKKIVASITDALKEVSVSLFLVACFTPSIRYDLLAGRSLRRFRRNIFVLRGVMTVGELGLNIISGIF